MMKKDDYHSSCCHVLKLFVRVAIVAICAVLAVFAPFVASSYAGSGTWILDPINDDWNTSANWSSNTVPGPLDTATFHVSNITDISVSMASSAFQLVFQAGADAYQISAIPGSSLVVSEGGISNDSGVTQSFVARADTSSNGALIQMENGPLRGPLQFIAEPQGAADLSPPVVWLFYGADAGIASFIDEGGIVAGAGGGETNFYGGKGGTATITNKAGVVSGAAGGTTVLWVSSSAGSSVITCEGATVAGAAGGTTRFIDQAGAANAILIANGGQNGGAGGAIQFEGTSAGDTAQVKVFGDGSLNIGAHRKLSVTIGSLEGNGEVFLGINRLSIGSNNRNTAFSGVMRDTGSLIKLGTGTLTLGGANSYIGGTTVSAGGLIANNRTGSATGTGAVGVNAGILSGKGIIAGATTIGTGSGAGAFLAPGSGGSTPAILTLQSALTFKADGTYSYRLKTKKAEADKVIANGVTIESGAQFGFKQLGNKKLTAGTVFTAISNTAATPIAGAFANLVDNSTFTAGNNTYQVDYEGGDGNDLTLTVVP